MDTVTNASTTYRAFRATGNGAFEDVHLPIEQPGAGQVRIRVEASGVCHTDAFTVEGGAPGVTYPRVPGHEIVGLIDAVGPGVADWFSGQRVGVGLLSGPCNQCVSCRRGDFVNCTRQPLTGIHVDGGYAEVVVANAAGLVSIPDGMSAIDAAPLLCAGVTTFNALRNSPARPGDLVAIHGIGGIGHLAVQYAKKMGFRVVTIARGQEKAELAIKLGAHQHIDSDREDAAAILAGRGGASVILTTVSSPTAMNPLVAGLAPRGRMIVAGAGLEPITIDTPTLIFGEKSVQGTLTGSTIDTSDTVDFSRLQDIHPIVEAFALADAPAGYAHMMKNKARFRVVLTT